MTAGPVDVAVHRVTDARDGRTRRERVPHRVALLAHVHDRRTAEGAEVVRLSPARRVERRAVQRDRTLARVDDGAVERREVRVAQVEQVGQ
jgi:hypothetical protein